MCCTHASQQAQRVLADFKAVEPFGKIAMHVLQRRVSMRVSFWLAVPPEFIHLAADCDPRGLKVGSIVLASPCLLDGSQNRMKYCYVRIEAQQIFRAIG
jgi:hypothetical protein